MHWLLTPLSFCFLAYLVYRLYLSQRHSATYAWFWPALVARLLGGLALGWVFTYYYPQSDTRGFFEDALQVEALLKEDPIAYLGVLTGGPEHPIWEGLRNAGQPRAQLMVKIQSFVSLISGGNYWLSALYYSFLAFWASWYMVQVVVEVFPATRKAAGLAFLAWPSLLFWGSGIGKESLSMAALFYLVALYVQWQVGKPSPLWRHLPWVVLAAYVLWGLKYYFAGVAAIAIGAHATLTWLQQLGSQSIARKCGMAIVIGALAVAGFGVMHLHPNFYPDRLPGVVVENYRESYAKSPSDNALHYPELAPTWGSVLRHLPQAALEGIFRPHVLEGGHLFKRMVALENLVLLLMTALALARFRGVWRHPQGNWIGVTLGYIGVLSAFLALSSPNLGTLIRYKTGFLPFLVYLTAAGSAGVWSKIPWFRKISKAFPFNS
jgi:hypothetical protein